MLASSYPLSLIAVWKRTDKLTLLALSAQNRKEAISPFLLAALLLWLAPS